jgi:(S)-ureidoglycine aminohydrolase
MKIIACVISLLTCICSFAQVQPLESKVYVVDSTGTVSNDNGSTRKVFKGSGAVLAIHEMNLVSLSKGNSMSYKQDTLYERFFIIQKGEMKVKLNDSAVLLGKGSVICVLPGDKVRFENTSDKACQFYEMIYRSIARPDAERGKKTGSFYFNWNDIAFKPHDKGGVRQFFDYKTTMLNRFDIHVTTMNPGNKSHDPHTHKNEEIILLMEGNAEMQIGTDHQKANGGDVVLLGSMVLHNLTNVGTIPCIYFAIQWN